MVFTLPTDITHGSESKFSHPQFHSGVDEQYNDNDSRNSRRNNDNNLWVCITKMEWRQYNSLISLIRRYSRFRFGIQYDNSWLRFHTRNSNESSQSGTRSNGNRKRNRYLFYYGLLISLLSIAPVRAEDPETTNVSNPVAAATGNVTNQAVQFQNNGAPSRQHYGPNISCNGSTMTFSPFYMGNHTTPYDIEENGMQQQNYTVAENWGAQLNFMVPLDREGLKRCRSIAARHEEKMRLDYELVRVLKCAELQQKGFMLLPNSDIGHMCSDVVPIAKWEEDLEKAVEKKLKETCKPIPKGWKQWQKQKYQCPQKTQQKK